VKANGNITGEIKITTEKSKIFGFYSRISLIYLWSSLFHL